MSPIRYRDAGVDVRAAEAAVRGLGSLVRSTYGPHVVTDLGAFAGLCSVPGGDPDLLLVSSMDGVGTKLKVAAMAGRFDTVGRDLVNHCVNDIGVHGAEPLFFLDYVAMGRLEPAVLHAVVEGLAAACRENGCALIGGETAEMPGMYVPPDFDLAGCIVGTVRRERFVDGSAVRPGDVLLGLPSTGLHTNGYSLARRVLFEEAGLRPEDPLPGGTTTVGDALLAVHRSYLPEFRALRGAVRAAAHITGGGIPGNLVRVLPEGVRGIVRRDAWTVPPVFGAIADLGRVPEEDLDTALNMGVGLVLVAAPGDADRVRAATGGEAFVIGRTEAGPREVRMEGGRRR